MSFIQSIFESLTKKNEIVEVKRAMPQRQVVQYFKSPEEVMAKRAAEEEMIKTAVKNQWLERCDEVLKQREAGLASPIEETQLHQVAQTRLLRRSWNKSTALQRLSA